MRAPREIPILVVIPAFLGFAAFLGSCASRPPATAETGPPPDFALSLTIVGDAPADSPLSPAWYVVEPNGLLRVATGDRLSTSPIPPVARQLTQAQYAEVWQTAARAGMLEAPPGGVQVAESSLPRSGKGAAYYIAANGHGRTLVIDGAADSMVPVAALCRRLAWVPTGG